MSSQPCFKLALGIQDYVAMVRGLSFGIPEPKVLSPVKECRWWGCRES